MVASSVLHTFLEYMDSKIPLMMSQLSKTKKPVAFHDPIMIHDPWSYHDPMILHGIICSLPTSCLSAGMRYRQYCSHPFCFDAHYRWSAKYKSESNCSLTDIPFSTGFHIPYTKNRFIDIDSVEYVAAVFLTILGWTTIWWKFTWNVKFYTLFSYESISFTKR